MAIGGKVFRTIQRNSFLPPELRLDFKIKSLDPGVKEVNRINNALVDTGSDFTFIPKSVIRKLNLSPIGPRIIESFDGTDAEIEFYIATITIEDVIEEEVAVGITEGEAIIGMDLLSKLHILINSPHGTFEIANDSNYQPPSS
jgi:predicted aspartyl protease